MANDELAQRIKVLEKEIKSELTKQSEALIELQHYIKGSHPDIKTRREEIMNYEFLYGWFKKTFSEELK